jgi:hypothetical protein
MKIHIVLLLLLIFCTSRAFGQEIAFNSKVLKSIGAILCVSSLQI